MPERILLPLLRRYGAGTGLRIYGQYRLARIVPRGMRVRVRVPDLAHPITLRARTTDPIVFKQALLERAIDLLVDAPSFVIDAGANIGVVSAFIASRFPEARIVAMELESGNAGMLAENMAPYPNVTVLHGALWSHETRLAVQAPDAREWAFQGREVTAGDTATVPAFGVADILERFGAARVDVLKIDIEGAEIEVFGPNAQAWVDRVGLLLVELHDWWIPGCTAALDAAVGARRAVRFTHPGYEVLRFAPEAAPATG